MIGLDRHSQRGELTWQEGEWTGTPALLAELRELEELPLTPTGPWVAFEPADPSLVATVMYYLFTHYPVPVIIGRFPPGRTLPPLPPGVVSGPKPLHIDDDPINEDWLRRPPKHI